MPNSAKLKPRTLTQLLNAIRKYEYAKQVFCKLWNSATTDERCKVLIEHQIEAHPGTSANGIIEMICDAQNVKQDLK